MPLIFIAVIAIVLLNLVKNKNAEAQKKAAARAAAASAEQAARTERPEPRQVVMTDADIFGTPDKPIRPAAAPAPVRTAAAPSVKYVPVRKPDAYGSMSYSSAEGMAGASTEGTGAGSTEGRSAWTEPKKTAVRPNLHVVKPVTESAHAHVESSISGIQPAEECEAEAYGSDSSIHDMAYDIGEDSGAVRIALNSSNAATAVLYSEILGKPKALRR